VSGPVVTPLQVAIQAADTKRNLILHCMKRGPSCSRIRGTAQSLLFRQNTLFKCRTRALGALLQHTSSGNHEPSEVRMDRIFDAPSGVRSGQTGMACAMTLCLAKPKGCKRTARGPSQERNQQATSSDPRRSDESNPNRSRNRRDQHHGGQRSDMGVRARVWCPCPRQPIAHSETATSTARYTGSTTLAAGKVGAKTCCRTGMP
jgi:hypothetical protein